MRSGDHVAGYPARIQGDRAGLRESPGPGVVSFNVVYGKIRCR
jgi:hypothetical protein